MAKKVLPLAGGALGSFIPIPGVGTAVGTALGNAASNMFEVNLEGMEAEDQEFDIARRFVRLAGEAAANAANAGPAAATPTGARAALVEAARTHAPGLAKAMTGGGGGDGGSRRPAADRDDGSVAAATSSCWACETPWPPGSSPRRCWPTRPARCWRAWPASSRSW